MRSFICGSGFEAFTTNLSRNEDKKMTPRRVVGIMVKIAVFGTIAVTVFGQAVHYLWNWLMPSLFRVPAIGYWQAVGLLGLSWILFGGLRGPGSGRGPWRRRMRENWDKMTPEEREKFRQGMRGRCGRTAPEAQAGS